MEQVTKTIQGVIDMTWPMLLISVVVVVSLRITYLIKNREHFTLYQELLTLSFIIYILCLFQIVTFQDTVSWSSNNFIPFREIFRYHIGSRLFLKNVLGNVLLFMPFGFFSSYYLKFKKPWVILGLTLVTSFSIEVIQMSIGRVFDVDDILLNIVGGYFGYLIYSVISRIGDRAPDFFKNEIFLDAISIIILVGVIALI
jgi:vanZ